MKFTPLVLIIALMYMNSAGYGQITPIATTELAENNVIQNSEY
jgi:hypothetical protein